jgi:predicted phage gp36 major capsid-like protein
MSNPWEYREVMKAHMRFGEERTVEQVLAEQKRRHEQAAADSRGRNRNAKREIKAPDVTTDASALPKQQLDLLDQLRNRNTPTD